MPLFDLGNDCKATSTIPAAREPSFDLSKSVIDGYKTQGYQVQFRREKKPEEVEAQISGQDQTRITAMVQLSSQGPNRTNVAIQLTGKVYVGGIKGALANDAAVQDAAVGMLKDEIKKVLKQNGLVAALQAVHIRERLYAAHQVAAARQRGLA